MCYVPATIINYCAAYEHVPPTIVELDNTGIFYFIYFLLLLLLLLCPVERTVLRHVTKLIDIVFLISLYNF